MKKFDLGETKVLDMTTVTDEEIEKSAINAERRMQEFHDKVATGNLTADEKESIEKTRKLSENISKHGFDNVVRGNF